MGDPLTDAAMIQNPIIRFYLANRHRRLKALVAELRQQSLLAGDEKTAAEQLLDLPEDLTDAKVESPETEKP